MSSASTFDDPGIDYNNLAGLDDIGTYHDIDPSPSLLPSGVSVETIAKLMHDELLHNAEFVRQVHLVTSLQELLEFRSKTTPNASVVSSLHPDCSTQQVKGDSSDLPLPHPWPMNRPAHYPEMVLWTLAHCKTDPDVNSSAGNKSRPSMQRAIRHEDSSLISKEDWKAMRQSAILISRTRIETLDITPYHKYLLEQVEKGAAKKSGKSTPKKPMESTALKKTFYRCFFFKEWFTALQELESVAPPMSLCAGYWKADMTLRSVLPDTRFDLPTPASSHGASSRAATPSNASQAPRSQSSIPPRARSQSSMPPPAPRSQSSMPPPAHQVRSSIPSRSTHPRPVTSQPATPPSPYPTPSNSSCAAPSHSEPSTRHDSSKAPQPPLTPRAPPAKKAGTKAKCRHDPSPPPQSEKRPRNDDDRVPDSSATLLEPAGDHATDGEEDSVSNDQQTSRTTCAKSAMQAGDRAMDGEEGGVSNVAARQLGSSPLPSSHPTTPKRVPSSAPTTPYTPVSYEESQDLDQDDGNGDDEGNKRGDGESESGDGDNNNNSLLTTLKCDDLIAWVTAHNIKLQNKRATKKEIIKAIMGAAKLEHPSKEDVQEIIESCQAKRNVRTA
ncbi:hypothetical protein EDB83DRAFT_2324850 [Lactarius deliciosus]|nr:hypothetical protein EDB83DRAFT_2324850 [Lactarius deliciosus]